MCYDIKDMSVIHPQQIHHLHVQEKTLVSDENKDSENKHASLLRRKNTEEETDYLVRVTEYGITQCTCHVYNVD